MEPSQKTRIQTSLEDIPSIQAISRDTWTLFKKDFLCISTIWKDISKVTLLEEVWPRKFIISHMELGDFEGIVSEMGSITLRPAFGKKQPIFYMSLVKYSNGEYIWEDEDQNPKKPEKWMEYFEKAVEKLAESLKKYPL